MARNCVVRSCVVVLVLFMGSILLRAFTRNILIEKVYMDNGFTEAVFFDNWGMKIQKSSVHINWAQFYPFIAVNDAANTEIKGRLSRLKQRITAIEEVIEKYTRDNLVNRVVFVEWAVRYEKAVGWNFLNGGVIDLGDGYLSEVKEKYDTAGYAASLAELYGFLQGLGIDFLYLQCPHKIAPGDPISGAGDFSNQNADDLLYALSVKSVPYLDLRKHIQEEGLDHHALFYKTDHHWKAETGLWASGILMDHLNRNYGFGFDLDRANPQGYRHALYRNWFLGSLGKKVTLIQTQAEDFTLITPRFDTDFSLTIPQLNLDTRGNFDIFINHFMIDIKDYYTLNPYGAYMYGDGQVIMVHNFLAPGGKKILLIKDSFANVVSPFLSTGAADLHILDLRHFNGSIRSYIEKNKPDMVMVLYNPSAISIGSIEMFDFR
ncbi:hypothetical protein Holit_03089 [Hollandina sp. SP2]